MRSMGVLGKVGDVWIKVLQRMTVEKYQALGKRLYAAFTNLTKERKHLTELSELLYGMC